MSRFHAVAVLFILAQAAFAQDKLVLDDYLGQVKAKGPAYRAAQASVEGYEKQSHQQDLLYSPQLGLSYGHQSNYQLQPNNPFYPTSTLGDSFIASLSDKLPFGPSISLGYAVTNVNLEFPSSALAFLGSLPNYYPEYFQAAPVASLSMPLVKDFLGTQTHAGAKKVQYQLESASQGAVFQREQVLFNAKVAYWRLALARETLAIRQNTLERSQKIWEWTKRRVARNLADPPDALQAEASVRVAELDLETAQEDERSARLEFNRYRNVPEDQVPEKLGSLEDSLAGMKVEVPEDPAARMDLRATESTALQQKAVFDEAYQNILPDITLLASYQGNGLGSQWGPANDMAFGTDHPVWTLGAQFNLSLDVFTAQRTADGYELNYKSAQLALEDKKAEVGQQWQDLRHHLTDVDKRLEMAAQIESIQKDKADQEKTRLELGRTTQFQLLSFENDYSLARLNRLSLVLEKLSYLAQAQWWLTTEPDASGKD
ncbi:MAG TPA: TolC family protein [bacterium]|nr:TolC family protein [bacterium]